MLNAMKKFSIACERYFERLARARVDAVLMPPGSDPWGLSAISGKRDTHPDLTAGGSARTNIVRLECTVEEQTVAAGEILQFAPARPGPVQKNAFAGTALPAADGKPPRTAA